MRVRLKIKAGLRLEVSSLSTSGGLANVSAAPRVTNRLGRQHLSPLYFDILFFALARPCDLFGSGANYTNYERQLRGPQEPNPKHDGRTPASRGHGRPRALLAKVLLMIICLQD